MVDLRELAFPLTQKMKLDGSQLRFGNDLGLPQCRGAHRRTVGSWLAGRRAI